MQIDPIPTMLSRIGDMKSSIEQFMCGGMAKSYDDYCRMVGEYSALAKVEQELKDIERTLIES